MLTLTGVSKSFNGPAGLVCALADVSLSLPAGVCTALVGENGAGKSTLMNCLFGLVRPDTGRIALDGLDVVVRSPRDAMRLGVGMVPQHVKLVETMTVAENVALGLATAPLRLGGLALDQRRLATQVAESCERFSLRLRPGDRVAGLSVGQRQRVEILKALTRGARTLILDEPTAVLTPQEAGELFEILRRLREEGAAACLITHRLAEVEQACQAVTVLRHGRVTHAGPVDASVTPQRLAAWMVGEDASAALQLPRGAEPVSAEAPARLRLEALAVPERGTGSRSGGSRPPALLSPVTLEVRAGEILGVAGVDGNGQRELVEALAGLRPHLGRVWMGDQEVTHWPSWRRFAAGLAHVPDDRQREGLVMGLSVTQNLALKAASRGERGLSRWGLMRWRAAQRQAQDAISQFSIRAAGPHAPVSSLSGGNQQKVVLARELGLPGSAVRQAVRVVVAQNPARGLDIAATRFVYDQLASLRDAGCAVLLAVSDLDELLAVSDRVAVLSAGRLTMTNFPHATREQLGELMLRGAA